MLAGCPANLTVSPMPTPEIIVNTTLICSSTGGAPSPSYYWLNGTVVASSNAMVTVAEPGEFFLTCVANSSVDGLVCVERFNVSGTAVLGLLHVLWYIDNERP